MIKEAIEEYVRCLRLLEEFHHMEGGPKFTAPTMLHEFILKYGQVYAGQNLPKKYRLRRIKQCFRNAKAITERSKVLTYCEGFVASKEIPLIIHHAWAVNRQGEVIDPTLRGYKDLTASGGERGHYMGVLFPQWFVKRYWDGALLDSDFGIRRTVIEIYESLAESGEIHLTKEELAA
jgi:hypothetical protein